VGAERTSDNRSGTGSASGSSRPGKVLPVWLAGTLLGVVLLGPVLTPGAVLTLDLVLIDPVPVPRGVWGLGPEIARRVPLWVPVAWLSPLLGGEAVGKALMVASIAIGYAGAHRFTVRLLAERPAPGPLQHAALAPPVPLLAAGAGVLYGASPFLLTRLAAGQVTVALAAAVLPWSLPHLVRPHRSLASTFLAAAALGACGHVGGLLAAVVVTIGLICSRWRDSAGVIGVVALAQLPWLGPGLVTGLTTAPADAAAFAPAIDGPAGLAALAVGHGFWQPSYQVGRDAPAAVAGIIVVLLAAMGVRDLARSWRAPAAALVGTGLVGALAGAVPGARDGLVLLTRHPGSAMLREGHRLLVLALVILAPMAALGCRRLAEHASAWAAGPAGDRYVVRAGRTGAAGSAAAAVVLVVGMSVSLPAVGGIDPRLRPVELPQAWRDAQALVASAPGTVLALPWHQYLDVDVGGTRRVLNPVSFLVGGDVLGSSDPELGQPARPERSDRREPAAARIVGEARAGRPVSAALARLGVRWVLVLHEVDWRSYAGLGEHDPGLRPAIRATSLDLWEVRDWPGHGPDAAVSVIEPLALAPPSATVLHRGFQPGWRRGIRAASEAPGGLVDLPEGGGPIWFWPALPVLVGDGMTLAGAMIALRARRRGRRAPAVDTGQGTGAPDRGATSMGSRSRRGRDRLSGRWSSIYWPGSGRQRKERCRQ
jgi:hypothetical protein